MLRGQEIGMVDYCLVIALHLELLCDGCYPLALL